MALKYPPDKNPGYPESENEALTAVHMALKMKASQINEMAIKLFLHALCLQPLHPDVLNHYGKFLEENDIVKADRFYVRALTVSPQHPLALANRERTLSIIEGIDEQKLDKILEMKRRMESIMLNHNYSSLKLVEKELYFQHIYHTVAIEGNTMTPAETRLVIEDRASIPGKSEMERNEILGLESALRYISETLVTKKFISILDILEIHGKVLSYANPNEAGSFRQTQVFVSGRTPLIHSDVPNLMDEFVEWLQSVEVLKLNPVKQAALAHFKLVDIHPFGDGNGRTARLLMNLILIRNGYPAVIIRKQEKSLYFDAIRLATEGDTRSFVRFIANATESTLNFYLLAKEYGTKCLSTLDQLI